MTTEKEKNEIEEIKEEVEEIKEIVEEIVEIEKEKAVEEKEEKEKEKKDSKGAIVWISIIVVVIIGLLILLASEFGLFKNIGKNKYGFDYNYNKVRSTDWDSLLTKKKIARAIDVPYKNINMLKNPDQNQVLEDPKALSEEPGCISILDEKVLNEGEKEKNLFNINISLCKNISEAEKLYNDRHDNTKKAGEEDKTINVKKFEDLKVGKKSYEYAVEKTASAEGETNANYAGLSILRGPFVVMIEEQEQAGVTQMSSTELKSKLAKYIDAQLKKSLASF